MTMPMKSSSRTELLQGTLDMLILRTLLFGPAHGHQISKHIQRTTEDLLQVEHGSLYPALHRLERRGWIAAKWESAGKDLKREFKYYRLTRAGKKQLVAEESKWKQLTRAISRVMCPAEEDLDGCVGGERSGGGSGGPTPFRSDGGSRGHIGLG